jgi:hypothetical protein
MQAWQQFFDFWMGFKSSLRTGLEAARRGAFGGGHRMVLGCAESGVDDRLRVRVERNSGELEVGP